MVLLSSQLYRLPLCVLPPRFRSPTVFLPQKVQTSHMMLTLMILTRKLMPCQFWWIKSLSLHASSFIVHNRAKCEASSQRAENKLDSTVYINVADDLNDQLFYTDQINISQLDVSVSSFRDIRWSFALLLYLFNIQLEKNVARFFLVLLVACFSFVVIGGFLFYKYRRLFTIKAQHLEFNLYWLHLQDLTRISCFDTMIKGSNESLEDCFWEVWACLCSSSTHLKQRRRIGRVIGFVLAIWGKLFYSRLLSTMNEQFRTKRRRTNASSGD
ncbi:uncharacterized protein LOC103959000 isoform X3 [Pyrus x bretschneideri]|uniref:uncharacterized protein LOC103959000 isoform X3 n=1 Tax=Pyrus x bretschneideri TaxID=225117 RepID=UPI00202FFA36|nr:uncharacterized protein LOC103959000 isoform X3 [Pyrus x bretschneideri]